MSKLDSWGGAFSTFANVIYTTIDSALCSATQIAHVHGNQTSQIICRITARHLLHKGIGYYEQKTENSNHYQPFQSWKIRSHMFTLWKLSALNFFVPPYVPIQVVPGRAGGGSFRREKNYKANEEFAYGICNLCDAQTIFCCERAFCRCMVVMSCAVRWNLMMS